MIATILNISHQRARCQRFKHLNSEYLSRHVFAGSSGPYVFRFLHVLSSRSPCTVSFIPATYRVQDGVRGTVLLGQYTKRAQMGRICPSYAHHCRCVLTPRPIPHGAITTGTRLEHVVRTVLSILTPAIDAPSNQLIGPTEFSLPDKCQGDVFARTSEPPGLRTALC